MTNEYIVYILTNKWNTTFYTGVSSKIEQRLHEHKNKLYKSFNAKYNLTKLVYYELFDSIDEANIREKQLKRWRKEWKVNLINKINPQLEDLGEEILQ